MCKEQTKYDFKAMGQAIKEARLKRSWTREQLVQEVDLAPRYIMSLENNGQHPSFITLMALFIISVMPFSGHTGKRKKCRTFMTRLHS